MGTPNYQRLAELGRLPDEAAKRYGFQKIEVDRLTRIVDEQEVEIKGLKRELESMVKKPAKVSTKKVKAPVKKVVSTKKPVKKTEAKIIKGAKKELDDMLDDSTSGIEDTIIRG